MKSPRPTKADLAAAYGKSVPDVIAPDLKVLFIGINPGLYTAAIGHHFGRPGNRFWPALHQSGFTPRLLDPSEERLLLDWGYGITNAVNKATARADELSPEELRQGGMILDEKIRLYKPRLAAFLGIGAYRAAFNLPKAQIGPQPEPIGASQVWVLPNPSGLNAHYDLAGLVELFRELRLASEERR